MLDVTGPLDALLAANGAAQRANIPIQYDLNLAAPGGGSLATTCGISLNATLDIFQPDLVADTVMIAGGPGARSMIGNARLVNALHELCLRTPRVASICTGSFPLAATGLLNNRRATTHWAHFDEFADAFPSVEIDRDALFITDGKYHSTAGVTSGIDYSLALIQRDLGRKIALDAARDLVVFLKRPGGQSQFSAHLAAEVEAGDPDRFGELSRWLAENIARKISVDIMADKVAMSPRNFARRFKEAMKVTPAAHLQMLRVDAARRRLSESTLSVAQIAKQCGFVSSASMRDDFQTYVHVTPEEFRARFQSAGKYGSGIR